MSGTPTINPPTSPPPGIAVSTASEAMRRRESTKPGERSCSKPLTQTFVNAHHLMFEDGISENRPLEKSRENVAQEHQRTTDGGDFHPRSLVVSGLNNVISGEERPNAIESPIKVVKPPSMNVSLTTKPVRKALIS